MSILDNLSEKQRGWFYFLLSIVFVILLVVMFVIAVLNGDDLSNWLVFVVGGLGLSGAGLASHNTNRSP
jgi:hypothetical protein